MNSRLNPSERKTTKMNRYVAEVRVDEMIDRQLRELRKDIKRSSTPITFYT